MGVLDGERVAELAVPGAELTLEVRGPQGVRSVGDEGRFLGSLGVAARLAAPHVIVTLENAVDRRNGRDRIELSLEQRPELWNSPASTLAELEDALLDLGRCRVRAGPRSV